MVPVSEAASFFDAAQFREEKNDASLAFGMQNANFVLRYRLCSTNW
jgi:hypothetical protein